MSREMKDSGIEWIGVIPLKWKRTKLLNILRGRITDGPHETPSLVDVGIPFISIDCLNSTEKIDFSKCKKFINESDYQRYSKKTIIEKGDILFTKAATIGKTAIVGDEQFMIWSPIAVIKTNPLLSFNKFIYYTLCCEQYIEHVCLLGSINTQINVGMRELEQSIIPIPTINEQSIISSYLDTHLIKIDETITIIKKTIEEYKKLKQSIITEAVSKGIRKNRPMKNSGIEWIESIPKEWKIVRGKQLFRDIDERSIDGSEELLTVSQFTGVTPRSQKNVNMFEAESTEGYKKCNIGDIAANTMWLWAGAIGVSNYDGIISPSYNVYRQINSAYDSTYLDFLLRIQPLVQHFESLSTGIRASRLRLYPEQFLNIRYPVPPMEEQKEIASYLNKKNSAIDSLIERKQKLIQELEQYKKSTIYEYVTGKKEVQSTIACSEE